MKSIRTFLLHACGFRSERRGGESSQTASCQSGDNDAGITGKRELNSDTDSPYGGGETNCQCSGDSETGTIATCELCRNHVELETDPSDRGSERSQSSRQSADSEYGSAGTCVSGNHAEFEPELVQVRIHRRFVMGPGECPTPLLPTDVDHIYIFQGSLSKFLPFSGPTCGWLLDVLDLIFGPYCGGQLYTPPSSSPEWIEQVISPGWRLVQPHDTLLAQVYEYVPFQKGALPKISHRTVSSMTSFETKANARRFRRKVALRDGACIISSIEDRSQITASHLIPKRMGDQQTIEIMSRFAPGTVVDGIFDPKIGFLLNRTLNGSLSVYKLGFKHISGDTYCIHYFGRRPIPNGTPHGENITLHNNSSGIPLPPPGLFSWHYLQCVFLKFGTEQYKNMAGLAFSQMPFWTRDDVDDAGGGDESGSENQDEPPWPTYRLERRMMEIADWGQRNKRMKWVRSWRDGILNS